MIPAAVAALTLSTPVNAQSSCAPHDFFVKSLGEGYQEVPVASGVMSGGSLLEVFASENDTQSWTVLITMVRGHHKVTCFVGNGDGWKIHAPKQPKGPPT